jgi:peptidoglycan/LPS O-acetylase OafA/YrhL
VKTARHRFAALDAWRGAAACLIVLFHFTGWPGIYSHLNGIPFVRNSWIMVDFFFVLSGFVISHAAFGKLSDAKAAVRFLVRRFGRLWPLHAIILAIFVAISFAKSAASHGAIPMFGPYNTLNAVFYNLFLIQGLNTQISGMWNAPSWSISAEFCAYFIFVGMCFLVARKGMSTAGPALALIFGSLVMLVPMGGMEAPSIFRCIYGFFVGHLTYLVWLQRKNNVPALEWLALGLSAMLISLAATRPLQFLAPPLFAFIVWVFASELGSISKFGKKALMQHLGAWSYSIYMTHWLGIHVIGSIFPMLDRRFGIHTIIWLHVKSDDPLSVQMPILAMPNYWVGDVAALLFLAATILVSWATYRWIENPTRSYFNELAKDSPVHVSESSGAV